MTAVHLEDKDEILFRQIHPSFIQDGELSSQPFTPTSQAFAPTPKDEGYLSVDRSSMTSAGDSYRLFTSNGHASSAVYGVTVGEFCEQAIACIQAPIQASENQTANPAHALADYNPHKSGQQKNKAKRLKQRAIARGRLHP
ncbi:hypothetical protein [Rhizobium leguminosarum]|uniref:Uncharacterized protein n=1 Tax=Rhizobium leguminosarum TaxID=384 RepID=A0A2K9ZF19_RHILE|nr:hypothetical protein [Rhizobium leguminosarum]AUW46857.1 hypothetical protein CUJ84_pRLN2000318 [Rhizobium leguminosarum]